MADIFISYAQKAKEPTAELAAALVGRGFDVWYDVNLLPGDAFGAVIMDEIDRATAVVTIWSREALTSKWVPAESERAHGMGKLISVRTPDVEAPELPLPFNREHAPLYNAVDDLCAALLVKGVHPVGTNPDAQSDLDRLSVRATYVWQTVKDSRSVVAIRAFHDEFYSVKLFRELAKERLAALKAEAGPAPQPASPPRILTPEDVQLGLDPGMHVAMINRIAVTADGRTMATASDDKTVKLWSLLDGKLLKTLRPPIGPGDDGKVYAVAIDPQGAWVASGGWTRSGGHHFVTIFDAATGAMRQRLGPLPNVIGDLEVLSDGTRLVAGLGGANGIRIYEPGPDGVFAETGADTDYGGQIYGLAFAADGRLATNCYDGFVRLYGPDLVLRRKVKTPGGERPFGLGFAPDGRMLAIGYADSLRVDVLDADTLDLHYSADTSGISGGNLGRVAWRADGVLAASGTHRTSDTPVFLWSDGGRGARRALPGPQTTVMDITPVEAGLAFGAGDPAFGLIAPDGTRSLFRGPESADLRGKLREHFLVSPDGAQVRFGLRERSETPVLFDLAARALIESPAAPPGLSPPNTKGLAIEDWEDGFGPKLIVNKGIFGRTTTALSLMPYERSRSLAIAPDSASFVLGTEWALRRFGADGSEKWERPVPSTVWGVQLAREGRLVLAAYGDGTIRWHRGENGTELLALFTHLSQGPDGPREWILFTPEGYFEASSPEAEKLIGWHVNNADDEAADFYPAETFAKTFRRPDIISKALDRV